MIYSHFFDKLIHFYIIQIFAIRALLMAWVIR